MSGLGEILEENSRLREMLLDRDGRLAAQAELFTAQLAAQAEQIAALKASNEQFALHFEFLKKRRQMAATERLEGAERQSPLFDGLEVAAPPRDPELEKKGANEDSDKPDGRKTAKPGFDTWTPHVLRDRGVGTVYVALGSTASPWIESAMTGVRTRWGAECTFTGTGRGCTGIRSGRT